jgi:hypothetical protein
VASNDQESDKVARLKMKDRTDVLASREQFQSDIQRTLYGTQGAASAVRRVDAAGADATALVAQLERQPSPRKGWTSRRRPRPI